MSICINDIKHAIKCAACHIKTGDILTALYYVRKGKMLVESKKNLFTTEKAKSVFYSNYMKKLNTVGWVAMVNY